MTWKPGGRSRCPGSPARLLISGRRSASRRPATWRCAPSYRPAWRAGRRALRNGRQTDMRVPHPPALAALRLGAAAGWAATGVHPAMIRTHSRQGRITERPEQDRSADRLLAGQRGGYMASGPLDRAMPQPADRVLQPIVAPEHLAPHNEARRAEEAEPARGGSLRLQRPPDLVALSQRQDACGILPGLPQTVGDVRLAAHLLPEAEPAPVSRTHELRTPALSHAEDG